MKENIETKDVQRTEYLDKNGLDMLWAKVKENTHNQVEVERDRAITQENRIIQTKADKSELHSSYVSNSTFTALQEKVAANTDAISDKQDAGNYLHYKTLNNEGYYEIPAIRIPDSGGNNKTDIDSQSISVNCSYPDSHTTITCDGISNTDNNANHVFATDGSIADLTQYAKAAALNNYVLTTALDKQVDTLNAAISGKQDAGNYIPYKNIAFKNKYVIEPSYSIEFRTDALNNKYGKAFIGPQTISITSASGQHAAVEPEEISVRQSGNASGTIHSTLNADSFGVYNNNDDSVIFKLNQYGIKLLNGDDNHVLTSNASTIDITQYAKKTELPVVPTKVSQLQNDSNFAYKAVVDELFDQLARQIENVSSSKQNKIIPGNIDISAANFQNTIVSLKETILSLITTLEKSGLITVTRS